MLRRILAVFKARDYLGNEVKTTIEAGLESLGYLVDLATSSAEAMDRLHDGDISYDLLITHIDIPIDRRTCDPNEQQGLTLLQKLEEKRVRIPSILVVPSSNLEVLSAVNKLILNTTVRLSEQK